MQLYRYVSLPHQGWRLYLAPTWGRVKDMRRLRYWAAAAEDAPLPERMFRLRYRRLLPAEIAEARALSAQIGIVQFEDILDWLYRLQQFAPRSESEERLWLLWRVQCATHLMRANWRRLTTFDLYIARKTREAAGFTSGFAGSTKQEGFSIP